MSEGAAGSQARAALDSRGHAARDRRRALLETLGIALAVAVAVGAGIAGMGLSLQRTVRDNYRRHLAELAMAAAEQVDVELHAHIRDPAQIDGPEYRRAVAPLRRMRLAIPGVRYIYTLVRDGPHIRFILDAADPGDNDGDGVEDRSGIWEISHNKTRAVQVALGRAGAPGRPTATDAPYTDPWGTFMTGYAPFYDSAGRQAGVAAIDMDASVFVARLARARNEALLGIVPASVLVLVLSLAFYRIRLRGLTALRGVAAAAMEAKYSADILAIERRRLRSVIDGTAAGTWEWNMATGEITVNEHWAAMIGRRREDLGTVTTETLRSLLHPEDAARAMQQLQASFPPEAGYCEADFRMRHAAGHWVWISSRGTVTERDAAGRPLRMAGINQDISQRKALESALTEAARIDKLTGLANRMLLMERLQQAIERVRLGEQQRFALLFLDFDHFKLTNDTLGHEAGDELLRQIAARLRGTLRAADAMSERAGGNLVARFGGDEFVVLVNDLRPGADAARFAGRLLDALAPVYSVGGRDVHSTASIGIVTSEQCLESAEAVIRNADVAMYEAKRSGRACSVVFDEAMHTRLTRHVTIESGLRKALGTPQLSLVYQPIVDLEAGRMVSAEALLRWEHPLLGPVSPAEFIPIAEESGLIVPLGDWVLRESCRQLIAWRRQDPERAPQTVSVNVSRAELALGPRLLDRIRATLERSGLPADALQLEVTEREVMRNPAASQQLMRELRAVGVRLAMDDFGTGTSSLACLRDYPFDTIKIDRSFVSDLAAGRDVLAVIHATITLVGNLEKDSVAEGVETASQVAILQSLGCRYAQGHYFSPPVPGERLLESLRTAGIPCQETSRPPLDTIS
jgi:diguanylate cyclase (GGDEF)-like protein/PAS domain S-box-containing protein